MQVSTDVLLTAHAKVRMEERGWSKDEVLEAIAKHDRRVVVHLMYKVITVYPKDAEMRQPEATAETVSTTPKVCSATNCTNSCKKKKVLCGPCEKKADKAAKKKKKQDAAAAKARKKKEKAEAKRLDELEKLADQQAVLEYQAYTRANAIAKHFRIQV